MNTKRIAGWGIAVVILGAVTGGWVVLALPRTASPAGDANVASTPTFFPTMRPVGAYPFPDPESYAYPTSDPVAVAAAETDVSLMLTQQSTYMIEGGVTPWIATEVSPLEHETVIIDRSNNLALTIPQGWYVYKQPTDATAGPIILMNFKTNIPHNFAPDGIMIQMMSSEIPEGQKPDNLALELFRRNTSLDNGFPVSTLTPVENLLIGDWPAFAVRVTVDDSLSHSEMLVAIPEGNRLVVAAITVGESRGYSDYTDGLRVLSTLDLSP